jgi:hypothetical protein
MPDLGKPLKTSQGSRYLGWDSNRVTPEYNSEALKTGSLS